MIYVASLASLVPLMVAVLLVTRQGRLGGFGGWSAARVQAVLSVAQITVANRSNLPRSVVHSVLRGVVGEMNAAQRAARRQEMALEREGIRVAPLPPHILLGWLLRIWPEAVAALLALAPAAFAARQLAILGDHVLALTAHRLDEVELRPQ